MPLILCFAVYQHIVESSYVYNVYNVVHVGLYIHIHALNYCIKLWVVSCVDFKLCTVPYLDSLICRKMNDGAGCRCLLDIVYAYIEKWIKSPPSCRQ